MLNFQSSNIFVYWLEVTDDDDDAVEEFCWEKYTAGSGCLRGTWKDIKVYYYYWKIGIFFDLSNSIVSFDLPTVYIF